MDRSKFTLLLSEYEPEHSLDLEHDEKASLISLAEEPLLL